MCSSVAVLGFGIRVGSPKFREGNGRMAAGKWTGNNVINSLINLLRTSIL